MAFTSITLTMAFLKTDGTTAAGTVNVTPAAPYTDGVTEVAATPQNVGLKSDGTGSTVLTVLAPSTIYNVIERIDGAPSRTYAITVLSSSPGGTIGLASLHS